MPSCDVTPSRSSWLRWIAAFAALLCMASLLWAVAERRALAADWLHARLGPRATFELRELGLRGATLIDLRHGSVSRGVDFAIDRVQLRWTPLGLLRGELGAVAVRGLRATLSSTDTELVSDPSVPQAGDDSVATALHGLGSLQSVALEDVMVRVATTRGEVDVHVRARLERTSSGALGGSGVVSARGAIGSLILGFWLDDAASLSHVAGRAHLSVVSAGDGGLRANLAGWTALDAKTQAFLVEPLGCLRLELSELSQNSVGALREPIATCIQRSERPLLRLVTREGALDGEAGAQLGPFTLALAAAPSESSETDGRAAESLSAGISTLALQVAGSSDASAMRWKAEAQGAYLRAPRVELELRDWRVAAERDPAQALSGRMSASSLRDLANHARFAPFELAAEVSSGVSLERLALALRATSPAGIDLHASGYHDFSQQTGMLELVPSRGAPPVAANAEPVVVPQAAPALLAQLPILSSWVEAARGELGLGARVKWDGPSADMRVDLAAKDLDLATPWGVFRGIAGRVRLLGPDGWVTDADQRLTIRRLEHGLAISDVRLRFEMRRENVWVVEEAVGRFAEGQLRTAGVYDPRAEERSFELRFEAIDLAELLARLDVPGLQGTGSLDGTVPIVGRDGSLEIRGGELRSQHGVLRYRPPAGARSLAEQRSDLRTAFEALTDFRYDVLRFQIDGAVQGALRIVAYIEGSNPDFQQGRPVQFTLDLGGARLMDLLKIPPFAAPGQIQEWIDRR